MSLYRGWVQTAKKPWICANLSQKTQAIQMTQWPTFFQVCWTQNSDLLNLPMLGDGEFLPKANETNDVDLPFLELGWQSDAKFLVSEPAPSFDLMRFWSKTQRLFLPYRSIYASGQFLLRNTWFRLISSCSKFVWSGARYSPTGKVGEGGASSVALLDAVEALRLTLLVWSCLI